MLSLLLAQRWMLCFFSMLACFWAINLLLFLVFFFLLLLLMKLEFLYSGHCVFRASGMLEMDKVLSLLVKSAAG